MRAARDDELDAAGACAAAAYAAQDLASDGYAAVLADARARAHDAQVLVAVDAGDGADDADGGPSRVLGTVTFALAGSQWADVARPGEAEFRMLGVDPAARGRGVGEALVRACLERARAAGAHRVVIGSQPRMEAAHRLYGRLGFTRVPELDWEPEPGVTVLGLARDVAGADRPA